METLDKLTEKLHLDEPGLVISVVGDLKEDVLPKRVGNTFRDSLTLTISTTCAWTVTNGLDHPLNRLVSECHRKRMSDNGVPAVGVAYCDKDLLSRSKETSLASRDGNIPYLENGHSMFIFFKKSLNRSKTQEDPCVGMATILIERARRTKSRRLPFVNVLLGGDLDELQAILQGVHTNIPVLVMQGTGGAADVLAETIDEFMDSKTSDSDIIQDEGVDSDETEPTQVKRLARKIVDHCRSSPGLLRTFELKETTTVPSLHIAMLISALRGPKLNVEDQIFSFLTWDHDRTNLQTLSKAFLQYLDMGALVENEPKLLGLMLKNALYTRYFLPQILSMLKVAHIQSLYQESRNIIFSYPVPLKVCLVDVQKLLQNLYTPLGSIGFDFQRSDFTSTEEKVVHLFLWSVLSNRCTVSRVLWEEVPEPLIAALVAYTILNSKSQQAKKSQGQNVELEQHASMFDTLAVGLLDQCHRSNMHHTHLSKKSLAWGNVSFFRMDVGSQSIMSHESFEHVINEVWMGDLGSENAWKVFWMCIFPLTLCLTYKRANGIKEKCINSVAAPVVKYFHFMLSYAVFLTAFTIHLLLGIEEQIPILSWLVVVWVFAALIEDLSQVIRWRGVGLMTALLFVPYIFFFVGFTLRNPLHVFHHEVGTLSLCIALALFYLNVLRFYLAFRAIGLEVVMMREMMVNMVKFMVILITIMLGYGIAIEVALFPQADIETHGYKNFLRRPVWQLFGELLLDEIQGTPECQENLIRSEEGDCPSVLGRKLVPAMTAIYMFITNVLLLNLLIAIFSSTYHKVESSAVHHLNYESNSLVMEFAVRSYFPPPLSLLVNVASLVRRCRRCDFSVKKLYMEIHKQAVEQGMQSHKTEEDVKWEGAMQDRYLESIAEKNIQPGSRNWDDYIKNKLTKSSSSREMSDLNDRLVKMESLLQTIARELRTDSSSS